MLNDNLNVNDVKGNREEAYATIGKLQSHPSFQRAMSNSGDIKDSNSGDINDLIENILETAKNNNEKSGELK